MTGKGVRLFFQVLTLANQLKILVPFMLGGVEAGPGQRNGIAKDAQHLREKWYMNFLF